MPEMTTQELCDLRDKLIMDPSLTLRQQEFLFGLLDEQIHGPRPVYTNV